MNEDLAPGHNSPKKHSQRKESLRPENLGDHVERNLRNDEPDDEEALSEVDVVVFNGRVFAEGIG